MYAWPPLSRRQEKMVLIERAVDTGGQGEVIGILGRDDAVSQPEIDQHKIDVEFECIALGGEGERLARIAQLEADQLVIADLRHEILRAIEVVAEEHVV